MKWLIKLLTIMTLIFSSCSVRAEDNIRYSDSIVIVTGNPIEKDKPVVTATAFAIDHNRLATAGHFCDSVQKRIDTGEYKSTIVLLSTTRSGEFYTVGKATILKRAEDSDLCLLYSKRHSLKPVELESNLIQVRVEDPVTIVSAPYEYFPVRRVGYIINMKAGVRFWKPLQSHILIAGNIQPGSSGGPVFWHGKVIGVVTNQVNPNHLDEALLAVDSETLVSFINEE